MVTLFKRVPPMSLLDHSVNNLHVLEHQKIHKICYGLFVSFISERMAGKQIRIQKESDSMCKKKL